MINDKSLFTETLAETYAGQGHLMSAARIYRQLLETRPGEPNYIKALKDIESKMEAVPRVTTSDSPVLKLISTWIALEISWAKLKQLSALRLSRTPQHEEMVNHVEFDIAE